MTTAAELRKRRRPPAAPSLWDQISTSLNPANAVQGLTRFGADLVTEDLRGLMEMPGTLAVGASGKLLGIDEPALAALTRENPLARFLVNEEVFEPYPSTDGSGSFGEEFSSRFKQIFPTLKSLQESMAGTYGRLRHPSRYLQASEQGQIVPVLLEDVSNVAAVGGAAARLGSAGAARAAAQTSNAATANRLLSVADRLNRVGNASIRYTPSGEVIPGPSRFWGAPSRVGGAILRQVGEMRQSPTLTRVGTQFQREGVLRPLLHGLAETRAGQAIHGALDDLMLSRRTAPVREMESDIQFDLHTQYAQQLEPLEVAARTIPADVQRAALLQRQGLISEPILRPLQRLGLTDSEIAERLREAIPQDITPESVRIAREAVEQTLDPATAELLGEASRVYETAVGGPRTRRYVQGRDEPYTLDEPQRQHRIESVEAAPRPLTVAVRHAEQLLTESDNPAEAFDAAVTLLNAPEAAPAPLRPVLIASRKLADGLQAEINAARSRGNLELAADLERMVGEMPTDLVSAARLQPRYVVGGSVADKVIDLSKGDTAPGLEQFGDPTELELLADWKHASTVEDIAAEDEALNRLNMSSVEAARTVSELEDWMRQQGVGHIHVTGGKGFDLPESRRVKGPLSAREGVELPTVQHTAESQLRSVGFTPLTFEGQARNIARRMLAGAENAKVRFLDRQHSLTAADFDLQHLAGERLAEAMSEAARERYGWDVKPWDPESKMFDTPTTITPNTKFLPEPIWRAARLIQEGSPSLAGKILGPPTDVWKVGVLAARPAWQIGNATGGLLMATLAGGVTPSELLRYARRGWQKARQAVDRPWELVDTPESKLFSAHPERSAQRFAITGETGGGGRLRRLADTSYRLNELLDNWFKSVTYMAKRGRGYSDAQAVRLALDALPDFRRRWWENKYVKPWLPFEPWLANVTRIAYRLAVDHPLRVAWILRLGDMYRDVWDDIDWMQGAVNLGGNNFLMLGSLNPFGEVPVLNPFDIGGNLNPFAKLGVEAVTGVDPSDMSPLTRSPGSGWVTATGKERPTPLLTDPAGLLYRTAGLLPQTRAVRNTILAPVERYETGDPIRISSGQRGRWTEIPTGESKLRSFAEVLGVPLPTSIDYQALLEVRRRREQERQRARERYAGR